MGAEQQAEGQSVAGAKSLSGNNMDGQWETQRRRPGKRALQLAETDQYGKSQTRSGTGERGEIYGSRLANSNGVVIREPGKDGKSEWRGQGRGGKLKGKHPDYHQSVGASTGHDRGRSAVWPRTLYNNRKDSSGPANGGSLGASSSKALDGVDLHNANLDKPQVWEIRDQPLGNGDTELADEDLLREEGEYLDMDKVDSGVFALEACLQSSAAVEENGSPKGTIPTLLNDRKEVEVLTKTFKEVAVSGKKGVSQKIVKRDLTVLGTNLKKRFLTNLVSPKAKGHSKSFASQQVIRNTSRKLDVSIVPKHINRGMGALPKPPAKT